MALVVVACQVLLAAVFAVSAFTKLRSRAALRAFSSSLVMLPVRVRWPAAVVVAAVEAVVPVAMLFPALGLAMSGTLLVCFSAWVAVSIRRGTRASCRCFGASEVPLGPSHLVRNSLLLAVVVLGWAGLAAPGDVTAAGLAIAAVAGLVGAILLIVFDDLADLFMERPGERV
ncbi:methylamine utilization protein MauE [Nonomuraea turkmeniaca]|uniref:Methylamine utilization protein MauE n=1 Tax=Nonomuraea turkmeniaca TaxID=103838 RepID=A0A5S4GB52_9ACTN|nr:MauE/DoxX family redox-associated membrane protein [Nonomuraea turkmeniaca]TMR23240.1 methylamine utilization protein MauE [Nonomuraea turkmeniaca]